MKHLIIGLSGKSGSGKDTAAEMFVEEFQKQFDAKFSHKKLAKRLKEMLALCAYGDDRLDHLFELDSVKQEVSALDFDVALTNRQLMQKVGQGLREAIPDFWIRCLFTRINAFNVPVLWVISDLRYRNEADEIVKRGGIIVRMERNSNQRSSVPDHVSETQLDNYRADYTIFNNTTKDALQRQVANVVASIQHNYKWFPEASGLQKP